MSSHTDQTWTKKPYKTASKKFLQTILQHRCDRLWQKQAFGLKISFVHFSLELINNNFWLKC